MTYAATKLIEQFGLTRSQQQAVEARGQDVVVTAGAGSGKTQALVARYLSLLDDGLLPRQIVAVTFTEKAARAMRNRIRTAILDWRSGGCPQADRGRWDEIEADIDTARIGTIHSLCANLLRAHPAEAGIDPIVTVLEEGLAAALKAQAIEDALAWAAGAADLKPLFVAFNIDELRTLLHDLLANRLDALTALGVQDPQEQWQQTILSQLDRFARDAEIDATIHDLDALQASGQLDADAGDKLGAQVRGLLGEWRESRNAANSGDALGAAIGLRRIRHDYMGLTAGLKGSIAKEAVRTLRERYAGMVEPWLGKGAGAEPSAEMERRASAVSELVRVVFDQAGALYQGTKDLRQALDFDDLEWRAVSLLELPEVRARWQQQIAAVLVDEFQDTNERQRHIVEALTGTDDGTRGRLFVVGDAKQSIYRFRGADVGVFRRLDRDVRDRGGLAIEFDVTFRAHKPLVEVLNETLARVMGSPDDPAAPYRVPFSPLTAARPGPRHGIEAPYLEFLVGRSDAADSGRTLAAALLARRLIDLHDRESVRWEEIGLLCRAANGFPAYEAALEDAGIPFVTVAGKGFYDRPEIRDILNILRAVADPSDDLAMAGLLRSPAFGLSDAALYQLRWPAAKGQAQTPFPFRLALKENLSLLSEEERRRADRAREIIENVSGLVDRVTVAELVKRLLDATLYNATLAAARPGMRLRRNVDKLVADASASGLVRVTEFLQYVETLRGAGAREGEAAMEAAGAVRLMTVHRAKGLEFPVVVIADASRGHPTDRRPALISADFGVVPCPERFDPKPLIVGLAKARDLAQSEAEDLRLLYVAATRAQEKLLISGYHSKAESSSWLARLAAATGVQLDAPGDGDGTRWTVELPESGQAIAAIVVSGEGAEVRDREPEMPVMPERSSSAQPLWRPVATMPAREIEDQPDRDEHRTSAIRDHRHVEGAIVGELVHEAIRRWRFPGDFALRHLLRTAALAAGIVDSGAVAEHVHQATLLLARFRGDAGWLELDAAERYHELPFSILHDQVPLPGRIDLLYRPRVGSEQAPWHVVDFKTDHVADLDDLDAQIKRHGGQLRRYRHAVSQLLGTGVETTICFLDFRGGIRWEVVGGPR